MAFSISNNSLLLNVRLTDLQASTSIYLVGHRYVELGFLFIVGVACIGEVFSTTAMYNSTAGVFLYDLIRIRDYG